MIARAHCRDILRLFRMPEILQAPTPENIRGFSDTALNVVFGETLAATLLAGKALSKVYSPDESEYLNELLEVWRENKNLFERMAKETSTSGHILTAIENGEKWMRIAAEHKVEQYLTFTPKNHMLLLGLCEKQAGEINVLNEEVQFLRSDLAKLRRSSNAGVTITIEEAFKDFFESFATGRKQATFNEGITFIKSFIESLPEKNETKVAELKASHIDSWIAKMKGSEGQDLSPITKRNRRNAVSIFMDYLTRKCELAEDPMSRTGSITGVSRVPENIIAIKRLSHLKEFIQALQPYPYWQAWAAVACFAGPRFMEQCWLKVDDVYMDEDGDEIRITSRSSGRRGGDSGTKTGRERKIPIEKTVLKPILSAYIMQRKVSGNICQFLFPSLVPKGVIERTKTPAGLWSSNRVFLDSWYSIAMAASCIAKTDNWQQAFEAKKVEMLKLAIQKATIKLRTLTSNKDRRQQEKVIRNLKIDDWHVFYELASGRVADYWTYGPSEWRHTFGTILGMSGWKVTEISRAMGNGPSVCERHYVAVASSGAGNRWPFEF